jgi:hypothetical protein
MPVAMLRKELREYIDVIPARKLTILEPLLSEFAKPDYTVEAANSEEAAKAEERIAEYYADPSSFVPLKL